jgi:predicted ester cyclase
MWHARDPTAGSNERYSTARTQAIVNAHLAVLQSAGDCGPAFADDVALTMMETGEVTRGRAAVASLLDYLHQRAFVAPPRVSGMLTGGERAIVEAELTGMHAGEFAGIAPTGRQVRVAYVAAYDLSAGAITAVRLYLPLGSLVRQLRNG